MTRHFSLEQMMAAIEGSGGITLTVSQRLQCDWLTAKRYIEKWESTKAAFASEGEKILDIAESVLQRNIRIAYNLQRDPITGKESIVDTGDVKWLLARKGKPRGYADKLEAEVGTADERPFEVKFISNIDDDKL